MEDIKLTEGQQRGLEMVLGLASIETPQTVLITGYAGTGKTTLLRVILDRLGACVLLAPTGKAAARITEVTGMQGSTIHRWIFRVEKHPTTHEPMFIRKRPEEIGLPESNLVIVDEASMVGPDIYDALIDLQSQMEFDLLFVGDSFQLPPVQGRDEVPFNLLTPGVFPDSQVVHLTEITRQALDSPIIRATMALRQGDLQDAIYEIDVVMPEDLDDRLVSGEDGMVICNRNDIRHALNARIRLLRGLGELRAGEPLLVLKNNTELDVYNGEVHTFGGWGDNLGPQKLSVFLDGQRQVVELNFGVGFVNGQEVILCKEILAGKYDKIGVGSLEKAVKYWMRQRKLPYVHANVGYVLTCHKAQGSEANSVLVCLQSSALRSMASAEGRRWLYTALSRARQTVAVAYVD